MVTEVEVREVKLAKITWDIWHEVKLRRRFLNILAKMIEFMLPDGSLFVLSIFGEKHEGSYVSNAERESAIAGIREIADKLEAGETWSHYTKEGQA